MQNADITMDGDFQADSKGKFQVLWHVSHDQSSCLKILGTLICKVMRVKTKLTLTPRNWRYQDCEKCVSATYRHQVLLAQEGGNMNIKYHVHSDRVTQVFGNPYMPQLLYDVVLLDLVWALLSFHLAFVSSLKFPLSPYILEGKYFLSAMAAILWIGIVFVCVRCSQMNTASRLTGDLNLGFEQG